MKPDTEWRKATDSDAQTQCTQVRRRNGMIEIGDDKDPDGPVLTFTPGEWLAFKSGIKKGEFDDLD
jgi:hypothetical protein